MTTNLCREDFDELIEENKQRTTSSCCRRQNQEIEIYSQTTMKLTDADETLAAIDSGGRLLFVGDKSSTPNMTNHHQAHKWSCTRFKKRILLEEKSKIVIRLQQNNTKTSTRPTRQRLQTLLLLVAAITLSQIALRQQAPCWAQEVGQAPGVALAQTSSNQQVVAASSCPLPAVNSNCQVNIVTQAPAVPLTSAEFLADEYSTLKQDTQANYKCDRGFELLGAQTITCLASGRWSAQAPNCVTNIAPGKPTNQSSTVKGGEARNANDAKLITQHDGKHCTETRVDSSPWWQVDLLQVYEIRAVRILGRACCQPQMSLHDFEIRVGNSSTLQGNRLCAWSPDTLDDATPRDFQCAHPILGRFVSIQMVGIESAMSLCEVMVFSTKEFPAERCNIQSTLAPSSTSKPQSSITTTTTSATTTTQQTSPQTSADPTQLLVFNRTCYETQATSGGSFLVADTYCKARGGALLHSVSDLTQTFIAHELERSKNKLKSKLVWLGARRENSSPNAQGPITPGSTSALVASDTLHGPLRIDRSLSAALHEFPIESLFAPDNGQLTIGETSPLSGPTVKLARSALLQASSGAGGSTSRGSQTFGLQTSSHNQHTSNRTIEHSGRSLIVSGPSQVASFFNPPISITNSPTNTNNAPAFITPPSSSSPSTSFSSGSSHIHRSLRPPSLVSSQQLFANSQSAANNGNSVVSSASWSPSRLEASSSSLSSHTNSAWRWVGDAASDTLLSPVTSFLWAENQPNNFNNQQDCIVLDGGKRWLWNDVTCELDYLPWICQYRSSTCGSPDRHENSTILELSSTSTQDGSSETIYQLGKTITYACPVGHRIDGSRTRKCLYDGTWSGKAPKCYYVNCGPIGLQALDNGRVVYLNQSQTTYGSQVKYVCYEDYVLVGDDTRQCQDDGKWGGKQPYCAYKWCPVLQQISNGYLNVSSYSENSIATYQCNNGYKLIGNDTRQCLLGGKWTNQEPFCQYVECGQPKQIPNGSYQLMNGTTNYLSVVSYTCNENYTLVGNSNKMICSHTNRWTGREPQCTLIDCGQPQVNLGSRFTGDSFVVHSTISYKCDPGFKEVSGSTLRTCGLDGQWTGQPITCKYVDCGKVPAILKGEVSYINGTTYLASQVAYECTSGNRISGHRVRFCGPDGRWTGTSPKCEEVRCDAPELPANGSAVYIGNDRSFKEQSFSVGVTVQYECDYGHVVRGTWSSRLCQASGDWSGEPPECKFVDCGQPPAIENGNYVLKHPPASSASGAIGSATPVELSTRRSDNGGAATTGTFTYYGTIAHYTCDANYKLTGPAQRECSESGKWRTPMPTCEPIQCPKPEFFDEYTQVSLIPKGQGGGDATTATPSPSVVDHQTLMAMVAGSKSIKLIANNQWLLHDASATTYNVGDKLHYSCQPGYELYGGPEIRTCTQYGQWSGSSTPRCRLIDCGRPAPIGQEGRYYLLNETTTFNSLVEYSCVRPFKLIEVKIRQAGNLIETLTNAQAGVIPILTSLPIGVKVCANNGQWMPNDQQPKCTSGGMPIEGSNTGQYDGTDNSLDGSNRVQVLSPNNNNNQQFNGNNGFGQHDDTFDASTGQRQLNNLSATSLWAKVIVAICLLIMLALIILTLICIRSGKKPKQAANHRASMLTPTGHQAAAAAAMQIQLANSKGLQQATSGHHLVAHHHHPNAVMSVNQQQQQQQQQQQSMLASQNIYINGMQKMFPGAMVGQSQMSSAGLVEHHHPATMLASYGDAAAAGHNAALARSMIAINGHNQQVGADVALLNTNKSNSLGMMGASGIRLRTNDLNQNSSASSDSYSRLSIDSDQTNVVGQQPALGHKTIRHNPNGLVTFVSPAQQQQQQQQKLSGSSSSASGQTNSSTSSGISSSSHHNQNAHQISPQSISTSLSVSSSSSPSSSSSSAHHTSATRLSASDSTASPSSLHNQQQQAHNHHLVVHHHSVSGVTIRSQPQQQSEYQAPQFVAQDKNSQPAHPPSLPAHPPPPHRVQQHHKQMLKQQQVAQARSNAIHQSEQQQQQQLNSSASGAGSHHHHYMEPSV